MSTRTTQKWIAHGRVAGEVQLRQTGRGKSVCNFKLACDRTFMTDHGPKTSTDYFPVTVWGKDAELQASHLQDGTWIYLEGYLKNHQFIDSHGVSHTTIECVPEKIVWIANTSATEEHDYVADVHNEVTL